MAFIIHGWAFIQGEPISTTGIPIRVRFSGVWTEARYCTEAGSDSFSALQRGSRRIHKNGYELPAVTNLDRKGLFEVDYNREEDARALMATGHR